MKTIRDPRQQSLSDPLGSMMNDKQKLELDQDWPGHPNAEHKVEVE